jgi:catechol 2,3-dioxygenase-like lactoylglutathione lyase family enzyme
MSVQISGFHHIGVAVEDLDATLDWYKRVFGVSPDSIQRIAGDVQSRMAKLPEADLRLAFVTVGGARIGLSEYHAPRGRGYELRTCDVGAFHTCLEVDDIQQTYEELKGLGVEFAAPPAEVAPGAWYTYFRDCNNLQFELVQLPAMSGAQV